MEQLIFIAVIVALSLLESIARGRKRKDGGEAPVPEWEWEPEAPPRVPEDTRSTAARGERAEAGEVVATYDEDRSYDEVATAESASEDEMATFDELRARRTREAKARARSSEGLIPADIWDEMAEVARSRTPKRPPKPPARPAPRFERPEPTSQAPRRIEPRRPRSIHLAHAEYGTDPSTRARPPQDAVRVAEIGRGAADVRRLLRGGPGALRRAVILQEVLGPPAAIRPERFDPLE